MSWASREPILIGEGEAVVAKDERVDIQAADGGPVEPESYDWPQLVEGLNRLSLIHI